MGSNRHHEYEAVPSEETNGILPGLRGRIVAGAKRRARGFFTYRNAKRRLPILNWSREYSIEHLIGDLIAGLTVGLMIIPQALAYAAVAGLPANYGLNSAIFGSFFYVIFGSTTELNVGPTAVMSLMTFQYSSHGGPDYAVLLCFISGIIEIVASIVNLGFLINFISQPVISGFTSAAAITIGSSQLKALFGLKLKTRGLIDTWVKVIQNLSKMRWQDLVLGIVSIVVLSLMKPLRTMKFRFLVPESKALGQRVLRQVLFFLSVGRNALVVIIASLIAYTLDGNEQPFTLTGFVQPGIPSASLPPFTTTVDNRTLSFTEMMSDLGIGIAMSPFTAVLGLVAVGGAFTKGKKALDANQEILSLGISTLAGSFFGSMPITACMSRSAVNSTSGVRTPAACFVVGVIVLLALGLLTPAFYYIPRSVLAAVIIGAVLNMVDYEVLKPLWRSNKVDLIPLTATFIACLAWGLEWGILLGIGVDLAMLLYSVATPKVVVSHGYTGSQKAKYVLVTPTRGLSYPGISHFQTAVRKAGVTQARDTLPVVVDCTYIDAMDYSSAKGIKSMSDDFKKQGQTIAFLHMKSSLVTTVTALHKEILLCPSQDSLDAMIEDNVSNGIEAGSASKDKEIILTTGDAEIPKLAPKAEFDEKTL
ncbi:sodium-independent sulfate anion transporter-like [Macrobrachium rosenbergii]|uniref:sodium-independent sulfate anion transporter-like n=1 Tax=Macrobrachium rosenbergii TaxID=79674 RepID=UPI0034D68965